MAKIIRLEDRRRQTKNGPTIIKIIDGKPVEYIDVDALSPSENFKYFERSEK
jgi:hypothetical protein